MTARLFCGLLATLAVVVCIHAILPLATGIMLLAIVAWSIAPGVLFAWLAYAPVQGRLLYALMIGPVWGFTASSIVLLPLWASGLRGGWLLAAPVLASAVAGAAGLLYRHRLTPPPLGTRDLVAVCLLIALVPAIVGLPFSRVGETVPDGKAYRAYFTADFVWRMAVAAELSKGSIPPRNPYLRGDTLHYYWLVHLMPAAEYVQLHGRVALEKILLMNSVALGIAFVLFFYGFVRQWVSSPAAALTGCAAALLCPSFEGVERIWYLWRERQPMLLLETLNIDAVTRWFFDSLPVDGLDRLLWYQPHHAIGYALGLSSLLVLVQARRPPSPGILALCGTLLGGCVLVSTFSAIMLTTMTAVVAVLWLARARDWGGLLAGAVAGATPLLASVMLAFSLRYVNRGGAELFRVLANPLAFSNAPLAIFMSFGPLLLPAIAGAILAFRRRAVDLWVVGVVVAISFAFYFFVDLEGHQMVYVGWRAGHLLFIAFATLTAYAVQEMARIRDGLKRVGLATCAIVLALGVPTFAVDLYNTQDVSNRRQAAGFHWTLVLSPAELHALDWIRRFTPQDAIVQVEPFARHTETWAYIPAFAERRMAAGLPISMVPVAPYARASERIRRLFDQSEPDAAWTQAASLHIDYLVVGAPETAAHPEFESVLLRRPDLFRRMFQEEDVSIYYVERPWKRR